MAADPVEIAIEFWDAWNARDHGRALSPLGPDAEMRPMRAQLEGKACVGHDGYRELVADVDEDWENLQVYVAYSDPEDAIRAAGF